MPRGTMILVPGIGGNDLYSPPSFFGLGSQLHIWLAPVEMLAGGWLLLGLDATGLQPSTPLTGPLIPAGALAHYYDPLIREMALRGWDVWDAHLDWRQQLKYDAGRVADRVRQLRDRAPVALVGHSRGGLVIREALALLTATGERGLVGRCAALGAPHYGSWAAAGLLAGWDETAFLLELLLSRIPSALLSLPVLLEVRAVVTSWPAPYELLPSPSAPGVRPDEIASVYNPAVWAAQGRPVNPVWLGSALSRWGTAAPVPADVEWCDFVGLGSATPAVLRQPANLTTSQGWDWSTEGDGVVPAAWARWPGRRLVTSPTRHGTMPYDIRVLDVLDQYLANGLDGDVVISGRVV